MSSAILMSMWMGSNFFKVTAPAGMVRSVSEGGFKVNVAGIDERFDWHGAGMVLQLIFGAGAIIGFTIPLV